MNPSRQLSRWEYMRLHIGIRIANPWMKLMRDIERNLGLLAWPPGLSFQWVIFKFSRVLRADAERKFVEWLSVAGTTKAKINATYIKHSQFSPELPYSRASSTLLTTWAPRIFKT
jgi:hypothetical protein